MYKCNACTCTCVLPFLPSLFLLFFQVQGLADTFIIMRYPFESEEAQKLNRLIFETIYFAALTASCELAQEEGTYETYEGSPVSKGV